MQLFLLVSQLAIFQKGNCRGRPYNIYRKNSTREDLIPYMEMYIIFLFVLTNMQFFIYLIFGYNIIYTTFHKEIFIRCDQYAHVEQNILDKETYMFSRFFSCSYYLSTHNIICIYLGETFSYTCSMLGYLQFFVARVITCHILRPYNI
jgi:hypothetical protein